MREERPVIRAAGPNQMIVARVDVLSTRVHLSLGSPPWRQQVAPDDWLGRNALRRRAN
jgi:hypothetical protein